MSKIKVVLPARKIPDQSVVSKERGTNTYKLYRSMQLYDLTKNPVTFTSSDGAVFLIPERIQGNASFDTVSGSQELVWHTDTITLSRILAEWTEQDEN